MIRRDTSVDQVPDTAAFHMTDGSRLEMWDRAGGWILGSLITVGGVLILAGLVRLYGGAL